MFPPHDYYAVEWKWGAADKTIQQIYSDQIRKMDNLSSDGIIQSMRDSALFVVAQGQFMEQLFLQMHAGVKASCLVCGWHKTKCFITVLSQCPPCKFTAGAEIYTSPCANTGVTQQDHYMVQQVLAAMLGVEIGPRQGRV